MLWVKTKSLEIFGEINESDVRDPPEPFGYLVFSIGILADVGNGILHANKKIR